MEAPRPAQKTEAGKGRWGELPRGGGPPWAAPRLASPPAEPSPTLTTAERARGQKSEPAPVEAVTQRPAGGLTTAGAARGDGAALLTPGRPSWGPDAGNRTDGREGRRHWAQRAAARPSFNGGGGERRPSLQLRAGWAWEAAQPGRRTKCLTRGGRATTGNARPGQGTRARPPARRRPCPRPLAGCGK